VDVFEHADDPVVTNAASASQSLTAITQCNDKRWLTSRGKLPADPATLAKVQALEHQVAELKALFDAGKYKDGIALAREAVKAAGETGFARIEGETLFWYGRHQARGGDLKGAEDSLYRAAWAADGAGDDRTRVLSWGALLAFVGGDQAKHEMIPFFRDQGLAAIRRGGGGDEAEANFQSGLGSALSQEGKKEDALHAYEKAGALWRAIEGDDGWHVGLDLTYAADVRVDLGDFEGALATFERALRIEEKSLGSQHPHLAILHNIMGCALAEQLKLADGEAHLRSAVTIAENALGPDYAYVAGYLDNLGQVLSLEGRFREALPLNLRALTIREKSFRADHPQLRESLEGIARAYVGLGEPASALPYLERAIRLPGSGTDTDDAEVQWTLAEALSATGHDRQRAHDLAVSARDTFKKAPSTPLEARRLEETNAWLALDRGHAQR
jgi:eukaryotic-like serine/threonine-protein kinase